ncbi:hypothetical protein TWF106_004275 [Orbilia oligospora]|uniref:Uncharacterized protein n=1 Tax=Orbilia oligospora TaxID=2813651 RepID=A0A7C8R2T1_ORBOL|nr:hypothetical protein TWF788_006191 [Orbilia oligospora]KAF3229356.1 hypothetical protein TWF106_004275 [Orbilia oligospora]
MKLSILSTATIILASGLADLATATCFQYWEGTAPFCDSKCPAKVAGRTCKGTGKFSSVESEGGKMGLKLYAQPMPAAPASLVRDGKRIQNISQEMAETDN